MKEGAVPPSPWTCSDQAASGGEPSVCLIPGVVGCMGARVQEATANQKAHPLRTVLSALPR